MKQCYNLKEHSGRSKWFLFRQVSPLWSITLLIPVEWLVAIAHNRDVNLLTWVVFQGSPCILQWDEQAFHFPSICCMYLICIGFTVIYTHLEEQLSDVMDRHGWSVPLSLDRTTSHFAVISSASIYISYVSVCLSVHPGLWDLHCAPPCEYRLS